MINYEIMKSSDYILSEKKINFNFFNQLSILEEIEEVTTETKGEKVLKTVTKLKKELVVSYTRSYYYWISSIIDNGEYLPVDIVFVHRLF